MTENKESDIKLEPNHESCNEANNNDPQTSTETTTKPDKTAHNINDLKAIDFNSADEIRQAMKAIIAGADPRFDENSEDFIGFKSQHVMSKVTETDDPKVGDHNRTKSLRPVNLRYSTNSNIGTRKRPGRPPKAGPSKKLKKQSVSSMYLGKLSNVVFLKRYGRGRRSDIDSIGFY